MRQIVLALFIIPYLFSCKVQQKRVSVILPTKVEKKETDNKNEAASNSSNGQLPDSLSIGQSGTICNLQENNAILKQFLDTIYIKSIDHYSEVERFNLIVHINKEGKASFDRVYGHFGNAFTKAEVENEVQKIVAKLPKFAKCNFQGRTFLYYLSTRFTVVGIKQ